MVKAASAALAAIALLIALAAATAQSVLSPLTSTGILASASALRDIPPDYLALYIDASRTCPGLDWTVLAAIGKVETDHGRSDLPGVHSGANSAGAEGPMQFEPATFAAVSRRAALPAANGHRLSPYNPRDAIYAAAEYLCENGARNGSNLSRAVYAYNHAAWYVSDVLTQAATYRAPALGTENAPGPAALQALNYAQGQLGLPYEWGGNGPAHGDPGFDCSGLTQAAYAAAGLALPRTAQAQYDAGPRLSPSAALEPGDLLFYGTPSRIHHVGLYIGSGMMIDAPRPHVPIRIEPVRYSGDDYAGATRPSRPPVPG
jgi:cell wall-associated NlpC family hydrolase